MGGHFLTQASVAPSMMAWERRDEAFARSRRRGEPARRARRDLEVELSREGDDLVVRQSEELGWTSGIAMHERENRLG